MSQEIPPQIATVTALFDAAVDDVGDKPWLLFEERQWTYAQAATEIEAAGAALAARGLGASDVCLATSRNTPEYVFLSFAAARLGAIFLAVNPRSTAAEFAGLIHQARPKLIATEPDLLPILDAALHDIEAEIEVLDVADLYAGPKSTVPRTYPYVTGDEPAFLIPTSG